MSYPTQVSSGPGSTTVGPPLQGFSNAESGYTQGTPSPSQPDSKFEAAQQAQGYPPAQSGYGQPPPYPAGPVVTNQVSPMQGGVIIAQPAGMIVTQQFRQLPVNCTCPHCHQSIITTVKPQPGGLTWLLCAGICLIGCWLGCCFIPFCIPDCQDIHHECPSCKKTVSVFSRL